MTASFQPLEERLAWDQTDEVVRAVLRDAHLMPLSAIGLACLGWLAGTSATAVVWGLAMTVSTALLYASCKRFRQTPFPHGAADRPLRRVFLSSMIQSAVCAAHMPLFWVSGHDTMNLALLLVFAASAMFAVSTTATVRTLLVANILLYTLVSEVVLTVEGGPTFGLIAMLMPLYFAILASSAARTCQRSREVLTLAQERDAMIADLTRANEAKTRFLANMSHELRTPLNAILGFSEMMKSEAFGPHGSPKYLEYASDIHASGAHLLDLINDLLDGARVETGNYMPADDAFALRPLLEECVRLVAGRAVERGLSLRRGSIPELMLRADRRGMKQVVINLLANAVKFTPAGGLVMLDARTGEDGGLVIAVQDNGPGIDARDLQRIFESFGQARHDVAERDRGVGLGLAIVKGILTAHDGTIEAQSAPGRGTTMTVRLPAARVAACAERLVA